MRNIWLFTQPMRIVTKLRWIWSKSWLFIQIFLEKEKENCHFNFMKAINRNYKNILSSHHSYKCFIWNTNCLTLLAHVLWRLFIEERSKPPEKWLPKHATWKDKHIDLQSVDTHKTKVNIKRMGKISFIFKKFYFDLSQKILKSRSF